MRIIITGGAGFIGANFIHYWARGHPNDEIVNIDLLTYASDLSYLQGLKAKNYTFLHRDIADRGLMLRLVRDADAIVNFAAESHVDRSISDSEPFIHSNIGGVHSILEAVRKYEKRFHHISTDEVFGSLSLGSKKRFTEQTLYNPSSPYAASKAAADQLVRAYHHTYKLPVTISTSGNNYGRFQHPEKLIPKVIIGALANKTITLHGSGLQMRDWIFVDDHCSAIETILRKGEMGETYCVSAEDEKNITDIAKMILDMLDRPHSLMTFKGERLGEDIRYASDPSKIRRNLKWKPAYSFEHGIRFTLDYYWGRYGKE